MKLAQRKNKSNGFCTKKRSRGKKVTNKKQTREILEASVFNDEDEISLADTFLNLNVQVIHFLMII